MLLISLSYLTFYFGGGRITSDEISLTVISITFTEPGPLKIIFWLIFFWFFYRYWVVHRSSFNHDFLDELDEFKYSNKIRNYVENKIDTKLLNIIGKPKSRERGYEIDWLRWSKHHLSAQVLDRTVNRTDDGSIGGRSLHSPGNNVLVQFLDIKGRLLSITTLIHCFFSKPSFSSYIAPFGIALFAIAVGLFDLLVSISEKVAVIPVTPCTSESQNMT